MAGPCFKILFTDVLPTTTVNIYRVRFSGSNVNLITSGMWVTNTGYGHAFKIDNIDSSVPNFVTADLEDVDGYNAANDPSGVGGGLANDTDGYVYLLDQAGIQSL